MKKKHKNKKQRKKVYVFKLTGDNILEILRILFQVINLAKELNNTISLF
ncbi:hypothetical protein [Fibrobacter sp.]